MEMITNTVREIYKELISIYRQNFDNEKPVENVKEINGNYHLFGFLCETPEYKALEKEYFDSVELVQSGVGRHCDPPEAKEFLLYFVTKLYADNGLEYGKASQNSYKWCMQRNLRIAVEGNVFQENKQRKTVGTKDKQGYLFACNSQSDGKIHWIDTFSALHKYFGIFGDKNTDFVSFLEKYTDFMSKLNNKALEPFYPRSINDICAVYTVYCNETSAFFKTMKSRLISSKKKTRQCKGTRELSSEILAIINKYGKDKDTVVSELSHYVRNNSASFENDRHYAVIGDVLSNELGYFDVPETKCFKACVGTDERIGVREKDKKIAEFEIALYKLVSEGMTEYEKRLTGQLFFGDGYGYDRIENVVTNKNGTTRGVNTVSLCVADAVRILAIITKISEVQNGYMHCSRENMSDIINAMLAKYGLVKLAPYCKDYCTAGRKMDWCIAAYVHNSFREQSHSAEEEYEL